MPEAAIISWTATLLPGAQTSALSTYYGSRGHKCSSPHLQCTLWSSKHLLSVMTSSQHDRTLPGGRDQVYLSINPSPAPRLAPACHTESTWMCACVLTVLRLFVTQWTVVCQAPLCQARIPDWVAISSSRGSVRPRDQTCISYTAGGFFTAKPSGNPKGLANIYWLNEWQSDYHNDRERFAIKNILDFNRDSEENTQSHWGRKTATHKYRFVFHHKSTMTTIKMWYSLLKFHFVKNKTKRKPSLWPRVSKLWLIGQIQFTKYFCMDSKLRRVFIFQWLKELKRAINNILSHVKIMKFRFQCAQVKVS